MSHEYAIYEPTVGRWHRFDTPQAALAHANPGGSVPESGAQNR